MVRSQIDNLTFGPSIDHNLCFKYSNGTWKPILDIYILRSFQWYKELFNPMSFNPYNFSLRIWESIGTLTSKVRAHLGVCGFIPSHLPTLPRAWNVTLEFHSQPTPLQAFALVMNPMLRFNNDPIATIRKIVMNGIIKVWECNKNIISSNV